MQHIGCAVLPPSICREGREDMADTSRASAYSSRCGTVDLTIKGLGKISTCIPCLRFRMKDAGFNLDRVVIGSYICFLLG